MASANHTSQSTLNKKQIIVLGAGVVGLTTALKLQQHGDYTVTIVAEVIPSDPKSIKYTSRWAGAHHVYNPLNPTDQHLYEEQTFDVMWELSAPGSEFEESFLRMQQTEHFFIDRVQPDPLQKMPGFRQLNPEELLPDAKSGVTFQTISIDPPIYLNYLLMLFLASGGRILRGSVMHINQVLEGGTGLFTGGSVHDPLPDAIVVCTGLGARFLGGVEDKDVYPIRGQTILVRAPWVRFGRTEYLDDNGACTYIIPRKSCDVILGGTRDADDWFPRPRPDITEAILVRALKLCPELASPEVRSVRTPTLDDIRSHIVDEGCGLRPARKGGIRLEVEWVDGKAVRREGRIPVIHNYGHGGFGYQSSWGCALKVLELVGGALNVTDAP